MELLCSACGATSTLDTLYCVRCRRRLIPSNRYDLTVEDFIYGPDQDKLEVLRETGPVPYLFKHLFVKRLEENMIAELLAESVKVDHPSALDLLVRRCADDLCLDVLPRVLVKRSGYVNAFTFGSDDDPTVVVYSNTLGILTEEELKVLLSHELAHVKSKHMLYHTLAEYLARGAEFSASVFGLGTVSFPLKMALLSWHRESEVTADRAGLLIANDLDVFKSFLKKVLVHSDSRYFSCEDDIPRQSGLLEGVSELFQTHPLYGSRMKMAAEFFQSPEFRRAQRKIQKRREVSAALTPKCHYCGGVKNVDDLFCPSCGRALV